MHGAGDHRVKNIIDIVRRFGARFKEWDAQTVS